MSLKISNASCPLGEKYGDLLRLEKSKFDRIVTKTCTLEPISILKYPLYQSTEKYSLNRFGLGNVGYRTYASYRFKDKPYVISVAGTLKDLKKIIEIPTTAHLLEFNVSCPNTEKKLAKVSDLSRLNHTLPFGVKLPPYLDLQDIEETSKELCILYSQNRLLTYVVCCNTLSFEGKGMGGAILKPISLYNIEYFRKLLPKEIEIWGCGGIRQVDDILEYELTKVEGVQIGTVGIDEGLSYTDSLIDMYREIEKNNERI